MGNIIKAGGTAGQSASFTVDDAGALTVTSASGATLLAISSAGIITQVGALTPSAGGSAIIDASNCATGEADVVIGDNLADALTIREGSTSYMTAVTTNLAERVTFGKIIGFVSQVLTLGGVTKTLVFGTTAGTNEILLTGQVLLCNPGSAITILKLPLETSLSGFALWIFNTGSFAITVQTSTGSAVGSIGAGKAAMVGTSGSGWGFLLGA